MTYCSNIKGVEEFINICVQKGMEHIVISPGSRNAPLTISFARNKKIKTTVIVDERSAGFFALGIAQQTRKVVGLLCTSGSALLNYAPAVSEAYHQGIPLLVISADRPSQWVGQDDSQTIKQDNIFQNIVKASYNLPDCQTDSGLSIFFNRMCNEAFMKIYELKNGPVHINYPLNEPLYDFKEQSGKQERIIQQINPDSRIADDDLQYLKSCVQENKKILIVASLYYPNRDLNDALNHLSKQNNIVVISETVSNISGKDILPSIDKLITTIKEDEKEDFKPDLIINFGGPIISKMLKQFIRDNKPENHWYIAQEDKFVDTFLALSLHINLKPEDIFPLLSVDLKASDSSYKLLWHNRDASVNILHNKYIGNINWSDMQAFNLIFKSLPDNINLHLANSSVVRYAQLFRTSNVMQINSNRGVSGIDGCTSTALGASYVNNKLTCLITGDLSFFYDSNAMWNKYIKANFRIIVINNSGGGIFRFIPGSSDVDELEEYFEHVQDYSIDKIAETFGFDYLRADNKEQLDIALSEFYEQGEKAKILEIKTPRKLNSQVLKNYFISLKNI